MLMLPARYANNPTLLTRNVNQNVVYLPENSCNLSYTELIIYNYIQNFNNEHSFNLDTVHYFV
jgi:hypothetical protein